MQEINIVETVATIAASLTIAGILTKAAWTLIDLKWKAQSKDVITETDLRDFCMKAQISCPKAIEMIKFNADIRSQTESISISQRQIAETLKEVVYEQKILRQITLPEKYISVPTFNAAIGRIERSMENAVADLKGYVEKIEERINDFGNRLPPIT